MHATSTKQSIYTYVYVYVYVDVYVDVRMYIYIYIDTSIDILLRNSFQQPQTNPYLKFVVAMQQRNSKLSLSLGMFAPMEAACAARDQLINRSGVARQRGARLSNAAASALRCHA